MTPVRGSRATRADVARVAGTSTAVVSYVINNGPRPVSESTRNRVLEAIESVGYEPDTIAQALALGVTGTYGLIVPDISNPFFAALAHELQDATSETEHVILLGDAAESKDRETELIKNFMRRRIDGLLLVGVDNAPDLAPLAGKGIPVVVLDRVDPRNTVSSVAIDNVSAAREVTEHLIAHGYTAIGIIAGPLHLFTGQDRYEGWRQALAAAGIEENPGWVLEAAFSRRGGLEAGRTLLSSALEAPRAVFASNEQQAVGLLAAAAEAGLRVPEDLALISFDGTDVSEYTVPKLSAAVQPLSEIARTAVGLLAAAASAGGDSPTTAHVVSAHELRIRPSCGTHPINRSTNSNRQ